MIFPTIYDNTSQIVQGPGYVAIRYEMIHDARVIPLDDRPHVSPRDPSVFRRFARTLGRRHARRRRHATSRRTGELSRARRRTCTSIERFRRVDASTVRYEADGRGPDDVLAAVDGVARPEERPRGRCRCPSTRHEGNYAMINILSGSQAEERAASGQR